MAMCALGIWNVGATPVFGAHTLELTGARFTSRTEVEALIGLDGSPNLFRFAADRLAPQLVPLPAVETANVDIHLPSTHLFFTLVRGAGGGGGVVVGWLLVS